MEAQETDGFLYYKVDATSVNLFLDVIIKSHEKKVF